MIDRDFERARRRSDWNRVLGFFKGKPSLLLPFDLVRSQIEVKSISYEGIHEIDVENVIGSVNRYHEFDREFLPKSEDSADRWSRVRKMFDSMVGFPPIKVYRIGEAFFVVDGNHRVSVARQLGMKKIEAEVTNYRVNVPIDKNTNIADLIIKKEYSDFLKQTNLDVLRPQQNIEFTRPGRYATILEHIDKRRYFLGLELGRKIDYEQAVESWYDSLYRPLIEIFDQQGIGRQFPGRTAADLYVWVTNHLYFLRERFGNDVGLAAAAKGLSMSKRFGRVSALFAKPAGKLPGHVKTGKTASDAPALHELLRRLQWMERRGIGMSSIYRIPSHWLGNQDEPARVVESRATSCWRSVVSQILRMDPVPKIEGTKGEWSRRAVVYNLFVRSSCAFDHNGDGEISVLNLQGLRETGTFLKAITLLPYIRSLGCNVIHLLPICRIGKDGRKGTLGSPYSIANPYHLDETLSEPLLGLGPDAEFKALVEASHRLGIRVVLEFVFRTAAKDSQWVHQHPAWFYWIRADVPDRSDCQPDRLGYASPVFTESALARLKKQVHDGDFHRLPAPPADYRSMFVPPPPPGKIIVDGSRYMGTTSAGTKARIPGAFADWPPDDRQPPWGDVTYLRLYDHPKFNYISYNTIRMYDAELATPKNAVSELWDHIAGVLPHFQNRFAIDGAMIDMGHALPRELMARVISGARGVDPSFAIWEEHFDVRDESASEGYNASVGNLWWQVHRPEQMKHDLLQELTTRGKPLPFLATPETHNTPRCANRRGGVPRSKFNWILGSFLPAIPFLHSGFELGETMPVNTGLDFAPDQARHYPEHLLPLYNAYAYNWLSSLGLIDVIRRSLEVRHDFEDLIVDAAAKTFDVPACSAEECVAYIRHDESRTVLVVGNPTGEETFVTLTGISGSDGEWTDSIDRVTTRLAAGEMSVKLQPWQCLVFTQDRSK